MTLTEINNKLVVVLGMHRSGTSAITRSLQTVGIDLGDHLMPPVYGDNDKGFWEDLDIVEFNIEVLNAIGSQWHSFKPIDEADLVLLRSKGFLVRAVRLLHEKLSAQTFFGFKDPRTAKVLAFWKDVFAAGHFDVSYVLALRNPLSVARSLAKRDGFDPEKSYLLWIDHVISSLVQTRGEKILVVDYDQLIQQPSIEVKRIAEFLETEIDVKKFEIYQNEFLDEGLRHTIYKPNDLLVDDKVLPLVQDIYSVLSCLTVDSIGIDHSDIINKIDTWHIEWSRLKPVLRLADTFQAKIVELKGIVAEKDTYEHSLNRSIAERDFAVSDRDVAQSERDTAIAERDAAIAERDAAIAERDCLINSSSWRLTRPLRFVARLIRHGFTNEDRQRLTQALRQRYHRLPLPSPAKSLARFLYHRVYRKTVRSSYHRALPFAQFHAPTIRPLDQQHDKPDYVVWGVIDWHFRHQRPQQLALALATTGRRVFYISPVLVDDERAGFEAEALDASGQLFQIKLFTKGAPPIYSDAPSLETVAQLRRSIGEVLDWAGCRQIVSLVDHPFWYDMASVLPNNRLVYDCMDHHEGFGNNAESLMQLEKQLLSDAELTITTSTWLDDAITPHAKHRALIRNAGEYEHFAKVPDSLYRDPQGRRVIGYYGAIAEWFDLDLVESVARQHPDCSVLLIGADTANAKSRLAKLHNVTFTGEVPYSELPHYLHGFDVCLLPFKVIPLTLATNPVKAYEYLGAGKPIVSVDLPEMGQFGELVYAEAGKDAFLATVSSVLSQPELDSLVQQRKAFAQGQTWQHRSEALIQQAESAARDTKVSVMVVTYNNMDLTRACLESLDEYSQYEHLEIIVVDNASSDGTPAFLSEWVANSQNRRLILNNDNRGFAAANNQGLAVANGDYLVLLNNDTYVTPGWIRTLVRHLQRDKTIGLIGPVTNNIGNEAKIDIAYDGMDEMRLKSAAYTRRRIGQTHPLRTAAFFCVMMPRATYERVGPLDEAFGRGFFEDDDYCRRIEQLGLRVVCAEDVFIHHQLSASFDKLKQQDRQNLFEDNKKIYEAKWGPWAPHEYR